MRKVTPQQLKTLRHELVVVARTVNKLKSRLEAISPSISRKDRRILRIICQSVALNFEMEAGELMQINRRPTPSLASNTAMAMACTLTNLSSKRIALIFGRSNHATVHYAAKRVQNALDINDPRDYRAKHQDITARIKQELAL